jgi:hypothetical protein
LKIREFLFSLAWALILAVGIAAALNNLGDFRLENLIESTSIPIPTDTDKMINPTGLSGQEQDTSTFLSTFVPEVGSARGVDMEDVLLLYNSNRLTNFDVNFCKIAEYYGLLCKRIDLNETVLIDDLLHDGQGNNFKLVGISANTFLSYPVLLDEQELNVLRSGIEIDGANLLISKLSLGLHPGSLITLTDGAIQGATKPLDSHRDWIVSSLAPEITREFTGQVINSRSEEPQSDFEIIMNEFVIPLISSTDDEGRTYPIFASMQIGKGSIFIDAGDDGESLDSTPLRALYYDINDWNRGFTQVVPLMFAIRYVFGEEAWHNDHNYANLTIDDPALVEPWNNLSYTQLLLEMELHNFHTTIAMHPLNWTESKPEVIDLFRRYPNYYSLVQHGNNGDGYEFYKYTVSEDDEYEGQELLERPLADQEADIIEGLSRMTKHRMQTGIPFDRLMVFPWGISPEQTLVLLKKYNYLATVNAQDTPLEANRPSDWDYEMYPAIMDYGNFPSLTRRHPGTYGPFQPDLQPFIFDLFIDKPALFYSHAYEGELFSDGIDAFNPVADQMNQLTTGVEWRSLGYILKQLSLEKINDDGSVDVRMYTNNLILTNDSASERIYHISKDETLNVPISNVTVNTHEFPYSVKDGFLMLDILLQGISTAEIKITYEN